MLSTCLAELKSKKMILTYREREIIGYPALSIQTDNKALAPVRDTRQIAIAIYNPARCNGRAAAAILN